MTIYDTLRTPIIRRRFAGSDTEVLKRFRDHAAREGLDTSREHYETILAALTQVTIRQWFRLPKTERKQRIAEFQAADYALQVNSEAERKAGVREETELYHALNGRVNDLRPTVPWWWRR